MLKKLIKDMSIERHRSAGIEQIRKMELKLISPEARFAIPFVYRGHGYFKRIEPRQNPFEIEELYKQVCALHPKKVLEIGTARGGTLYLWLQAATTDATVVSVDLPEGDFGGAYPECRVPFYKSFARPGQTLHLMRTDSHLPQTLEQVKQKFNDEPIDFAFIDGDHTYEGVKADFIEYGPLVRPGGIIAFHDILPRPDLPDIQVDKFWNEIKVQYNSEEFIGTEASGRKIGIGMIRVGDRPVAAA